MQYNSASQKRSDVPQKASTQRANRVKTVVQPIPQNELQDHNDEQAAAEALSEQARCAKNLPAKQPELLQITLAKLEDSRPE